MPRPNNINGEKLPTSYGGKLNIYINHTLVSRQEELTRGAEPAAAAQDDPESLRPPGHPLPGFSHANGEQTLNCQPPLMLLRQGKSATPKQSYLNLRPGTDAPSSPEIKLSCSSSSCDFLEGCAMALWSTYSKVSDERMQLCSSGRRSGDGRVWWALLGNQWQWISGRVLSASIHIQPERRF